MRTVPDQNTLGECESATATDPAPSPARPRLTPEEARRLHEAEARWRQYICEIDSPDLLDCWAVRDSPCKAARDICSRRWSPETDLVDQPVSLCRLACELALEIDSLIELDSAVPKIPGYACLRWRSKLWPELLRVMATPQETEWHSDHTPIEAWADPESDLTLPRVRDYIAGRERVTVSEVIEQALHVQRGWHSHSDEIGVAEALKALGWEGRNERCGVRVERVYRPRPTSQLAAAGASP